MTRYYAIGDVHGDLAQLTEAHRRIQQDLATFPTEEYKVIHIGDLVDRREDSRGVLNFLIEGLEKGEPWIVLKGNHDRLFQWFLEDPYRADGRLRSDYSWLHERMGGTETLTSYGVYVSKDYDLDELHIAACDAVPIEHKKFLSDLPLSFETEDFFFCHAGIRPGVPLAKETEEDLLWMRGEFHAFKEPHPKIIVHGHTPIDRVTHYGNRINIDTGAAWGKLLSTVFLEGSSLFLLDGLERHLVTATADQKTG